MSLVASLLAIILVIMLIAMILFVLFGQITVRKLRKNPNTKYDLGMEFVSGLDVINVAQALTLPRAILRKFKKTPLSALYADADLLYKHTSRFDRILARLFFILFSLSGSAIIILGILDWIGIFEK